VPADSVFDTLKPIIENSSKEGLRRGAYTLRCLRIPHRRWNAPAAPVDGVPAGNMTAGQRRRSTQALRVTPD